MRAIKIGADVVLSFRVVDSQTDAHAFSHDDADDTAMAFDLLARAGHLKSIGLDESTRTSLSQVDDFRSSVVVRFGDEVVGYLRLSNRP